MPSYSSANFQRLAGYDVNPLLVERVAGGIAQFDVMISRAKCKLLQLSSRPGVSTIHIDKGVFRHIHNLDFPRIWNWCVPVRISPSPTIRAVPTPARPIPAPTWAVNADESPTKMRRGSRHEQKK